MVYSVKGSSGAIIFSRWSVAFLVLVFTFVTSILASPLNGQQFAAMSNLADREAQLIARQTSGNFYLRIMPLGASITRGSNDSPNLQGRGYRKYLRDRLRNRGWKINMVGSFKNGQGFNDNDTEGWPGFYVGDADGSPNPNDRSVHNKAKSAVPKYKPNLILLNVGFNDAHDDIDLDNVGHRMEALLKTVFNSSPGVVVVLSTLLPSRDYDDRVVKINEKYRALVPKFLNEGYKIQLADMHDGFITTSELYDGIHPTDVGAIRMAAVWDIAIKEVEARGGWLKEPSKDVNFKDDATGSNTCDKQYKSGASDPRSGQQVLYAKSANVRDDGTYKHSSVERGPIAAAARADKGTPWEKRWRTYTAQLVNGGGADRGGERDEFIRVIGEASNTRMSFNQGGSNIFKPSVFLDIDSDCISRGITWGDVNNDGLDDFICIRPNGEMWVSINQGGDPPTFKGVGKWKDGVSGYQQANVRLGDIDGDGRLDYCVIASNGDLTCWRNGGIQRGSVEYWEELGVVWTAGDKGLGTINIEDMRLVDINGDFRSDVLWVDNTGRTTTWINQRGVSQSLRPYWLPAGVTHPGRGVDIGDRENIIFGRMFTDHHTDYLHWEQGAGTTNILAWESRGEGGTFQKGDGVFWGDMTGTGVDDYVFIYKDGSIVIFVNGNTPPDTSKYKDGAAWSDKGIVLQTGMNIKALHIGDWNGDGKADVIGVDKKSGALMVWLTSYSNGAFSFHKITSGGTYCTQGWGVGRYDIAARFADLTGSGCVDYICLDPDGRASAWLNDCKGGDFNLRNVGQVKTAIGQKDRANIRFADVNGDGKAEYMWVNKFIGDTSVWINQGEVPESEREANLGSKVHWDPKGPLYSGSSRGQNTHFPNLGGVGRADIVHVDPTTGYAWVSFNSCPVGGDENGVVPKDPSLPAYGPMPQCPWPTCYSSEYDDNSWGCDMDPFGDDFSDEYYCENLGDQPDAARLSDLSEVQKQAIRINNSTISSNSTLEERYISDLEKRVKRKFEIDFNDVAFALHLIWVARQYPGSTRLLAPVRGPRAQNLAFRMAPGCSSLDIQVVAADSLTRQEILDGWDTEHNPDLQFTRDFIYTVVTGRLPGGGHTTTAVIPSQDIESYWNANILPANLPTAGNSRCVKSANDYFNDRFGSQGNRAPMVLCERNLNQVKGRVFNLNTPGRQPVRPIADSTFQSLLDEAVRSVQGQNELFEHLRQVIGVFRYINHPQALPIVRSNVRELGLATSEIGRQIAPFSRLRALYDEFYPAWYEHAADLARTWLSDRILDVRARFTREINAGNAPPSAQNVLRILNDLYDALGDIRSPF